MRSTSTKQTAAERLAQAIVRDRQAAQRIEQAPVPTCFACGRPHIRSSRFCSEPCRTAYDECGLPPYDPDYASKRNQRWYGLPLGRHGFLIECRVSIVRFPLRRIAAILVMRERDGGWLTLVGSNGWLFGSRAEALQQASWLARNLNQPVRA
jgi:hypothetical protein